MDGAAVASKLYRLTGRRIRVLEAGPFLLPEHVQNMSCIGLNVPGEIPPAAGPSPVLFSFDKYSAMPNLIKAIREDVTNPGGDDANRRVFGVPRAYVNFARNANDAATWDTMDQASVAVMQAITGVPNNIEYLYDGGFQPTPFPLNRPFPEWRCSLGSTCHEAGTLRMGDDPATSVTDPVGRFHHLANAYACDQSIFPAVGSANPTLTGVTLPRRLADALM